MIILAKKKEEFKTRWFINVPDESGKITPVLVKDTDDKIKPEYTELVAETSKRMRIRWAKTLAEMRGLEIEIEE